MKIRHHIVAGSRTAGLRTADAASGEGTAAGVTPGATAGRTDRGQAVWVLPGSWRWERTAAQRAQVAPAPGACPVYPPAAASPPALASGPPVAFGAAGRGGGAERVAVRPRVVVGYAPPAGAGAVHARGAGAGRAAGVGGLGQCRGRS